MAPTTPGISDAPIPILRPRYSPGARPLLPTGLAATVLPTSASRTQLLPVIDALAPLLPARGLQRGTVLLVDTGAARSGRPAESGIPGPGGASTLSMALVAAASGTGSWCLAIGFGNAGVAGIAELGVDLDHLAMIPSPGHNWARIAATALEGMDIVLLRLPFPARPAMARNLAARAREKRAVLIVLAGERAWPEGPDLVMRIEEGAWSGLGDGHGHLRARRATVMSAGRRGASRPVRCRLWLPGPAGTVEPEVALDPEVPVGTVDPAVHHGAVNPATARHPAAMAVRTGAMKMRPKVSATSPGVPASPPLR